MKHHLHQYDTELASMRSTYASEVAVYTEAAVDERESYERAI